MQASAYPMRAALLVLIAVPVIALAVVLICDTYRYYKANTAEHYCMVETIRSMSAGQTGQFLAQSKFVLSELAKGTQVRSLAAQGRRWAA